MNVMKCSPHLHLTIDPIYALIQWHETMCD